MGDKYLMIVDENGFRDRKNNFYMVGVIFEEDYFVEENSRIYDLKKIMNYDISKIGLLTNDLHNALNECKFNLIISKVNSQDNNENNVTVNAFKKLLSQYHGFILEKGGENCAIAIQYRKNLNDLEKGQIIFNIYMKRDKINDLYNYNNLINRFLIIDYKNEQYDYLINMYNIIKNLIVYSCDNKKYKNKEWIYGDIINEKIMKIVMNKIFIEEIAFDVLAGQELIIKYDKLKTMEELKN